jgi:hypothetical protein
MPDGKELTLVERIVQWMQNNRIFAVVIVLGISVIAIAKFTDAIVTLEKFFGWRTEQAANLNSATLTIPLAQSAVNTINATNTLNAALGTIQKWKRLDSDKQRGFYQRQLAELSRKLTEAHVRPNGVKFLMGIRADTHEAWISVFVREGDNLPFVYSVQEEKNDGVPGSVETRIIQKLSDQDVLPIGWTHKSDSFIYATVALQLNVR